MNSLSLDLRHHKVFSNLPIAPCFSWWFVFGFVLWIEKGRSTYCVEDIKEINYTTCGYYLLRIKLLGLGNISSVKNPVWSGDMAPPPNRWWNPMINARLIPLPLIGIGCLCPKRSPVRHPQHCHPFFTKLNCKPFLSRIVYGSLECYLISTRLWRGATYRLRRRLLWVLFISCISVWQVTNEIPLLKLNPTSFLSHTHKEWIVSYFLDSSCTRSSFITFIKVCHRCFSSLALASNCLL